MVTESRLKTAIQFKCSNLSTLSDQLILALTNSLIGLEQVTSASTQSERKFSFPLKFLRKI